MKEKGNCVLRKDCFQSEFWCHGPSFLSPHLHAGLPEIQRLVFCSSEAKTAFVFPSLRNNLQRCEIIHQSQRDNFCWLPHTLCIFIIPLFPPQLRGAADNMSGLLSILQQPQANKSNGTVLTSSVALIIVFTPVSKTSPSSVSSLHSCVQVLHHVPTIEFISCCQIWCDFRRRTAFNSFLTSCLFSDLSSPTRCLSLQVCAVWAIFLRREDLFLNVTHTVSSPIQLFLEASHVLNYSHYFALRQC